MKIDKAEVKYQVMDRAPWPALRSVRLGIRAARHVPRNRAEARQLVRTTFDRRVLGKPALRKAIVDAWRVRLRFPGSDERLHHGARVWGHRFARRSHLFQAIDIYALTEAKVSDPDFKAALSVQRLALQLRRGIIPEDLNVKAQELLALADRHVADSELDLAGARLQEALNVVYHRTRHFEDEVSPLAADPDSFLAPFRESSAFSLASRTRERPAVPGGEVGDRPRRILFVTFLNWNFLGDLIADYRDTDGVEVRTLDLADLPDGPWRAQPVDLVQRRLHNALHIDEVEIPAEIMEPFEWADTVFVEWGHRALAWVSLLPRLRARVVARIHSYEMFTAMPLHTDWGHIDDLIFVAAHIRALAEHAIPGLAEGGPRLHTIPNRNVLSAYQRPKLPAAEFTLGLVGWDNVTKDPMWAVDVLTQLRKHDDRWRLRLVGRPFPPFGLTGRGTSYRDKLEQRLELLGDIVEQPGWTDDVPEALQHIGVIVSSSRREGTHEGLLQGVASGAFPLVRNWPYVARWGGAATMVPRDWVVETPEEAAARLIEVSADPAKFHALRDEARDWVIERYDWSVVRPRFDALLLHDESPEESARHLRPDSVSAEGVR